MQLKFAAFRIIDSECGFWMLVARLADAAGVDDHPHAAIQGQWFVRLQGYPIDVTR